MSRKIKNSKIKNTGIIAYQETESSFHNGTVKIKATPNLRNEKKKRTGRKNKVYGQSFAIKINLVKQKKNRKNWFLLKVEENGSLWGKGESYF